MSTAALLEVDRVDLSLDGRPVLQQISLRLEPGQVLTVVGLNGAGKTTLLRVILGLQRADAGHIRLRPGTRVGYMPQRLTVDPTLPLTVYRLLRLGARRERAELQRVLAEVGAAHTLDRPLQSISGGELQRVLLARALAREPDLLVLDEPVQSVDVAGQHELYRLIAEQQRSRGCAVLMVSHDLHLVMSTTDQVICLNHHICCSGPPELISRHPAYRQLFGLGRDQPLAVYRHHHDHQHGAGGEVIFADPSARPPEQR